MKKRTDWAKGIDVDDIEAHGKVYVRGEISNGSTFYDSRLFGPVDLRDVVGRVRLVYFSFGPAGIRWNRVGRTF